MININLACSRLSVSEDNRKSEWVKSEISGERDPDLSFFPTRSHSSPARFFSPPLTESLEQAKPTQRSATRWLFIISYLTRTHGIIVN